jgi:TrkA domain protein
MTVLTSTDLPGVGKRYCMQLGDTHLVLIVHHSGEREIFLFADPNDDEPLGSASMSDDEARKLGAVLLGADFQPVDERRMQLAHDRVRIHWIRVDECSPIAGGTIADFEVRRKTGTTIIGISRGDEITGAPDPDTEIMPGDTLMVIGSAGQVERLEDLCRSRTGE